jgi:lipopolysaccharide/colanic/teichoic acid biosynthesis glycosyltransferase
LPEQKRTSIEKPYVVTAILTDFLVLAAALLFAVLVRFGAVQPGSIPTLVRTWLFFATGTVIASVVEHLYQLRTTVNRMMHVFRMIRLILMTSTFYVILFFLLHFPSRLFLDSRIAVMLFILFWAVLWIPSRTIIQPALFSVLFGRPENKRLRVLLMGPEKPAHGIARILSDSRVYNRLIDPICCVCNLPEDAEGIFRLTLENLEKTTAEEHAIVFSHHEFPVIARYCQKCYQAGMKFSIYSSKALDLHYFDPWLSLRDYGAITFFDKQQKMGGMLINRLADIVVSLLALLLLSPVFLFTALLIKLGSRGPVFFSQPRIGRNMEKFRFYKFRSMYSGVSKSDDKAHQDYFRKYANGDAASDDGKMYKLDQSVRITPFGRFIRKTSIDELPQFINVLNGSMTLVGPRPCIEYELEHYSSWQLERFAVKPGLTGIWQVYGRSRLPFDTAQFLDFLYTIDRTQALNLRLILKTIPVMLFGRGGV